MASSLPSLEQEIQPTRWPWFRVYRQPWKTIYLASQLSYHHLVRKPFSAILFLIPALRPNPKWTWQQSRFVTLLGEFFHIATQAGLIHSRKDIRKEDMASAEKCGKDCQGKFVDPVLEDDIVGEIREIMVKNEVHPAGVPAYWRGHGIGNSPISPAGEDERLVIHFHGGGYVTGSALQGEVPSTILALSQAHPSKPISRVLDVDYRLCRTTPLAEPANAFPAALLDAVSVMYYAVFDLGFHPRNIVFSGNSAGAHVILGATRYLRDAPLPASRLNAKGVPHHLEGVTSLMPGGMILIAPLCNVVSMYFEQRSPESSFVRNATTDIIGRHG
ncbi:hypothetical protein DL93DRAFT_1836035 [Clavulina sp. PMI_390]|nr:hypothetical protein DL93DRAFT_1836035 [Clavulina sp. PMI_390]